MELSEEIKEEIQKASVMAKELGERLVPDEMTAERMHDIYEAGVDLMAKLWSLGDDLETLEKT